MPAGTSINIFLPDGNPDGVRLVFKSHWTGIAVTSPRSRYAQVRLQRNELRTPGVYVLIGPAEDVKHEHRIYVGEGEDPRARIDSHHANKDFWNRVVLFTSFGQTLNKATIRYLEARLLQLAATAQRAELDNGNAPALPPLSEPEIADAESFLSDMLVIYPILGINSFELLEQTTGPDRLRLLPTGVGRGLRNRGGVRRVHRCACSHPDRGVDPRVGGEPPRDIDPIGRSRPRGRRRESPAHHRSHFQLSVGGGRCVARSVSCGSHRMERRSRPDAEGDSGTGRLDRRVGLRENPGLRRMRRRCVALPGLRLGRAAGSRAVELLLPDCPG